VSPKEVREGAAGVEPTPQAGKASWRRWLPSYPMVLSTLALAISAGGFYNTYLAVRHSLEVGSISVSLNDVAKAAPAPKPADPSAAPRPSPVEVRAVLLNKGNRTEVVLDAYAQLTAGGRMGIGQSNHAGPLILKPGEAAIIRLPANFTPDLVARGMEPLPGGPSPRGTPPRLHLFISVVSPPDVPGGRWIRIGELTTDPARTGVNVMVSGGDWVDLMKARFRSQDPFHDTATSSPRPRRPPPPPGTTPTAKPASFRMPPHPEGHGQPCLPELGAACPWAEQSVVPGDRPPADHRAAGRHRRP
jgi:hypothetical protein